MSRNDCDRFEELLAAGGERSLEGERLDWFMEHRRTCETCKRSSAIWPGLASAIAKMEPEPLPPLVERSIAINAADTGEDHRAKRRLPLPAFAAGFAVAAAAAIALVLSGVLGTDTASPADTAREPSIADARPPAWEITALDDGRRVVRIDDVTNLWVDGSSVFRVEKLERRAVRVFLESGKVVADIGPHNGAFSFVVATPDGEVEAKGTIFAVEILESGASVTRVLRGLVEVRASRDGAEETAYDVGVGQKGILGQTSAASTSRWETEGDFCLLRGCRKAIASGPSTTTAADAEAPPEPAAESPSARSAAKQAPAHKPRRYGDDTAPAPGRPAESPVPSKASPHAKQLVEEALSQRRSGDYDAAAVTYRRLISSHPSSTEASNALVSLGQLELVNLADPSAAAIHFGSYLARSPSGILAQEARLGKVRAYDRMGDDYQVIQASGEYLRAHPGGYAGAEVTLRRADARRKSGDCEGALRDYRQLKKWWPASPQVSSAEDGIRACEELVGSER